MSDRLIEAIVNIREDEALQIVKGAIEKGRDPYKVMALCQEAMKIVGDRFEKQEYFLPELIACGEMLRKISDILKPFLATASSQANLGNGKRGKIVLGTVRGDIHDIGKDIVGLMLDINGFDVCDLGVDVSEEKFVSVIREVQPQVVALSGILTLAHNTMKSTVEALEKAGLRNQLKVMIGGSQVDEKVNNFVKADGWGSDAMAAVRLSKGWIL